MNLNNLVFFISMQVRNYTRSNNDSRFCRFACQANSDDYDLEVLFHIYMYQIRSF